MGSRWASRHDIDADPPGGRALAGRHRRQFPAATGWKRSGGSLSRVRRSDDTWLGLLDEPLPIEQVRRWTVRDDCGAVVVFCGTTRDHAGDLTGVTALHYEAYEAHVVPRLEALVAEARSEWPAIVAVAALHRTGRVALGEEAVVVAVSFLTVLRHSPQRHTSSTA